MNKNVRHFFKALFIALLFGISAPALAETVVQILSAATSNQKIGGATLLLQKNGERTVTAVTNEAGLAVLDAPFEDDQLAMLIVKKSGYSNLVVKCPCARMTYALSPAMHNLDGMRIVLNWPSFWVGVLHSHLVFPGNDVYIGNQAGDNAKFFSMR
ncbi:MAG TPA: hypothetical protein VFW53_07155, partial [Gallionella sp.]|nr:hypothetical protein [Gallionella sp.]